jgi:hypothetical protein
MVINVGGGSPKQGLDHLTSQQILSKNPLLLLGSGIGPGQKWWPTALRIKDFFTFPKIFTCFTNVTRLLDPIAIKLKITGDQVLHSSEKVRDTDIHINTYARKKELSWL